MNWLGIAGRTFLVTGFANKKSVAWHAGTRLAEAGARVVWSVRTEARRKDLAKASPGAACLVCDVERDPEIDRLAADLARDHPPLDGLLHSIAYADYGPGTRAFHETRREDFLRAVDVSCFSLVRLSGALSDRFAAKASVVAVSISTTRMAAENYGLMAPAKAALDSSIAFLAKSFAAREVRFNSVNPGLLKTSASAGIPGYLESYLYAESATLRKRALETSEVADAIVFLLSPRSSGVNAQGLVIDAGMGVNYFDRDLVQRAVRVEERR